MADTPLHALNPTGRFTDRAADYVRYRPDYPAAVFDRMLQGLGPPAALEAVDVGAGTGISARQLADRGPRVVAVEPNAAMRAAAAPHPRVTWRDGQAEATGLAARSADLVLVAQAFHWFRAPEALAELRRVLRPGGRLAVMWNGRDRDDPGTRGYVDAIRAVNGEHPAEMRPFDPAVLHASGHFTPAVLFTAPHVQRVDRAGLLGRATSASYVPTSGEAHATLVRLLDALFERHRDADDRFTLHYVTRLFLADPLPD